MLRRALSHPLTRGADIDSAATTELRRRIIREKAFLRRLYLEWYAAIAASVPPGDKPALELGSGAGFLEEHVPGLITSDVLPTSSADLVLDGGRLPFRDASLRAIVMIDAFHHVGRPRALLSEAARCLAGDGVLAMIEPWRTGWSEFVYRNLHHEPFRPEDERWEFDAAGPLSDANGALPWIVFERDRGRFETEFPELRIVSVQPMMPFAYLLSGGVSMRSLAPGFLYAPWRGLERLLERIGFAGAMFARIVLRRTVRA